MSSRLVRQQKIESLIIQCQDYIREEKPGNGGITLFNEVIALLKGKLASIQKGNK